jgi:hydrogenase-4 component F
MTAMDGALLIWVVMLVPVAGAGLCLLPRSPRAIFNLLSMLAMAYAAAAFVLGLGVFGTGPTTAGNAWLRVDALSAFHLFVVSLVFVPSTLFAKGYFATAEISLRKARRFAVLWQGSLAAMTLVLLANHLGLMWVGVETTTLATTFLIALHRSRESIEATWKYLMICSVGIAIAFLGMLIFGAASSQVGDAGADVMLWTRLREVAPALNPKLVRLGFIFLLVGYGTKVGLAPMHTWLPDAHSQAPAPVSSMFSAAMLSTVLYCLMRYLPVVDIATGHTGWPSRLLCLFGALSMVIAAAFILFQRDLKRMLAYCSVEHMGIVAMGLGLGSLGAFAAMFHTLNHSLAKSVGFCSAGRLGQMVGTHEMSRLRGIVRLSSVWGSGLALSLLALIGVVPSALFMSELLVVKAAVDAKATAVLVAFLVGGGTVFLGMFAHTMAMTRGQVVADAKPIRATALEALIVFVPAALLVVLGVWMPNPLREVLVQAAAIVSPTP